MQMQKEQQLSQGSLRIKSFHLSAEFPHLLLHWHHRGKRSGEHGGDGGRGSQGGGSQLGGADAQCLSCRPAVCRRARGLKISFSSSCLKSQEHLQIPLPFFSTFLRPLNSDENGCSCQKGLEATAAVGSDRICSAW